MTALSSADTSFVQARPRLIGIARRVLGSATDTDDPWSSFSNFGNPPVDFAEPGSSIPSTYKNGGYATLSGTSMAAPHLAGILLTKSTPGSGGAVDGDPDGNPDTIGTK